MQYLLIFVNIYSILVTPTHVCYADRSRRHFFCVWHALLKKDMCLSFFVFGQHWSISGARRGAWGGVPKMVSLINIQKTTEKSKIRANKKTISDWYFTMVSHFFTKNESETRVNTHILVKGFGKRNKQTSQVWTQGLFLSKKSSPSPKAVFGFFIWYVEVNIKQIRHKIAYLWNNINYSIHMNIFIKEGIN